MRLLILLGKISNWIWIRQRISVVWLDTRCLLHLLLYHGNTKGTPELLLITAFCEMTYKKDLLCYIPFYLHIILSSFTVSRWSELIHSVFIFFQLSKNTLGFGLRLLTNYVCNLWNIFGILAFWIYFAAIILHFINYKHVKILLALSATFSILLLLREFLAFPKVGLYILMILSMVSLLFLFWLTSLGKERSIIFVLFVTACYLLRNINLASGSRNGHVRLS